MQVSQINNTNFKAGNVSLNKIASQKFTSLDAIKKIAEDKNVDIFICKHRDSEYLPHEDMYSIFTFVNMPVYSHFGFITKRSIGSMITNKNTSEKELSVKLYNAVIDTIENLEKKLSKNNKA